ncbi:serine/threonine-protein kinase [Streptacidiphilus fuscans]|uniref:non-specific serine/threonine protein kinase n=1 Tax=Streptacidiphilus fuscans TaxID=2789292 RepID=A0A931B098_9ACTN|nr:serine/threonine-protein kinase [Streptacidiphilus fuscans]MBF9066772.1 serine/threonine protein kinase [Streptacidiphilus fuscans]
MEAHIGQVIGDDRYELIRELGEGGFGRVWQARDHVLGVDVAIKEVKFPADLAPDQRAELLVRAKREARNAAKLRDNPNVVTVHDVLEIDASPWIVMQLIEGKSLREELMNGPLSEDRAIVLARGLLKALEAAHEKGIVHRDIKPANVLIASDGSFLLTDFGISKHQLDTQLTATNILMGTPGYTAPECWQGTPAGAASDVYSVGVTLYEAIEGELPFPCDVYLAALTQPPRTMEKVKRLSGILLKMLGGDPSRRPTTSEARQAVDFSASTVTVPGTDITEPGDRKLQQEVTFVSDRREIFRRFFVAYSLFWLPCTVVLGVVLGLNAHNADSLYWLGNNLIAGLAVGIATSAALWELISLISAATSMSIISDEVQINLDHISVSSSSRGNPLFFTVSWSDVEHVSISGSGRAEAVFVWFLPGRKPSQSWTDDNRLSRRPDGSIRIYPLGGWFKPTRIPMSRIRGPLRRFAAERYVESV